MRTLTLRVRSNIVRLPESLSRVYDRQQKQAHLHAATEAIRPPKVGVGSTRHIPWSMEATGLCTSVSSALEMQLRMNKKKKGNERGRGCAR